MVQKTTKDRLPILSGVFHEGASPDEKSCLIGSRCSKCGRTFFPKRFMCPVCLKEGTIEDVPLSTKGRIDTYSVVQVAPMGFTAPYIQAFVDLPEGPRVFTIIAGCEPSEDAIAEGQEVELVIDKIREDEEGNDLIGYKFRPVGKK
jgi:uncharacterized OB-fold protein